MEDEKLEACPVPHCASTDVQVISGGPGCHYIRCRACGLQTDDGSRERVTAMWNSIPRRPSPTDQDVEGLTRERDAALMFLDNAISKAPEPLRALGEYLGRLLDEDRWPEAERYLNAALAVNLTREGWSSECPKCVASKFPCDEHYNRAALSTMADAVAGEREACARIVEENQETTTNTAGGTVHHLSPRKHGNIAGLAYAAAIRARGGE